MKAHVVGVKRVTGTAKESGQPYDICRAFCLVPVEQLESAKMKINGHGYELAEIELDPSALAQFAALKFPVELELATDQRFQRGEFKTVVTGCARTVASASAGVKAAA